MNARISLAAAALAVSVAFAARSPRLTLRQPMPK